MSNRRTADLNSIKEKAEKLKEAVWQFLDQWYPPEYGQPEAVRGSINEALDAIDSMDELENDE